MIMLMIQSALQGLITLSPQASPAELVCALNRMLFENVRRRMQRDEHVTLCLVRYAADGSILFAGAHENMLLFRAHGDFESIPMTGAWLGVVPDLREVTTDTTVQLQPGDLLVLCTDGIIEARGVSGKEFGTKQLRDIVEELRDQPPSAIRNAVMERARAWAPTVDDDMTLIVIRCQGIYWPG